LGELIISSAASPEVHHREHLMVKSINPMEVSMPKPTRKRIDIPQNSFNNVKLEVFAS
jgi:hypothetical protein